jgi:hypothetical protein
VLPDVGLHVEDGIGIGVGIARLSHARG